MGTITIEFADRGLGEPCDCCGGTTTFLTRFVYSDGDAHAVYYASFSNNHPGRWVSVAISLGDWGEDGEPRDRVAFALRIRSADNEYQVMVVDASCSPWQDVAFLGRMLGRREALAHRWIKEVFHITDHIVTEDQDVKTYLDQPSAANS